MQTKKQNVYELRIATNFRARLSECLEALDKAENDVERAKAILMDLGYIERPNDHFNFNIPDDAPSEWAYILAKANRYLRLGSDTYRKADYFGMPEAKYDDCTLKEIESCFRQFLAGKGYLEANPVENVSISGFYAATRTLHLKVVVQVASSIRDEGFIIDFMLFEHIVDKSRIGLFNKVTLARRR
jgi:hypothetical protein